MIISRCIQNSRRVLRLLQQSTLRKTKKTRIFCQGSGNWTMVSACRNMMKHVAESIKTLAGQLNRFDEVRESDQLRRTVIEFSGTMQVLVWLKSQMGTYAFHWTQPCSYSKDSNSSIIGQTTQKTSAETFIETGVVQAIETSVRSYVCQPSLLIVPMLPYPLSDISSIKNWYTDNRDAEHDSEWYPMQLLMRCGAVSGGRCFWGCWPMHRCWGLNVLPHAYWGSTMQLLWKNLIEEAQKELSISSHLTAFMRNTQMWLSC